MGHARSADLCHTTVMLKTSMYSIHSSNNIIRSIRMMTSSIIPLMCHKPTPLLQLNIVALRKIKTDLTNPVANHLSKPANMHNILAPT